MLEGLALKKITSEAVQIARGTQKIESQAVAKQELTDPVCYFGNAFVLHDSDLSNMGLHQNVVMQGCVGIISSNDITIFI